MLLSGDWNGRDVKPFSKLIRASSMYARKRGKQPGSSASSCSRIMDMFAVSARGVLSLRKTRYAGSTRRSSVQSSMRRPLPRASKAARYIPGARRRVGPVSHRKPSMRNVSSRPPSCSFFSRSKTSHPGRSFASRAATVTPPTPPPTTTIRFEDAIPSTMRRCMTLLHTAEYGRILASGVNLVIAFLTGIPIHGCVVCIVDKSEKPRRPDISGFRNFNSMLWQTPDARHTTHS
mmetsp:Transcript_991/g.2139  ORF Transcript_991/g.2139 Transcript_991/m.2139 type:complete len:233 (-) Transcript_991:13-711(-)